MFDHVKFGVSDYAASKAFFLKALEPLPAPACQSFTFDRGTEFMGWRHLKNGLGARSYFCEPNSPWQKGTVENTNRRIRRNIVSINLVIADNLELAVFDSVISSRQCRSGKSLLLPEDFPKPTKTTAPPPAVGFVINASN